ncbi:MAG: outer membrane lipoprotein carrier protein LolA [Syntrophales bacterium]|jgi:outer membrane lipoprotein carrier protein|nr:outer membrane lipoprotein carrier protein LolA [Syntrophales bacterium]MDY0043435.1 outer membrane lipoprotein carrier protein LolA [Syntrophales bacterium]
MLKRLVKYLFMLFLAVFMAMMQFGNDAFSEETLDHLVMKVQNFYEHTEDFEVSFVHKVPVRITGNIIIEHGTFFYKKPKRLRWEYKEPEGKTIVVNPEFMWFYLPDDNKVFVQETEAALQSQLAVKFLAGLGNLKQDFEITFKEPSHIDKEGNYLINLTPKGPAGGIRNLTLTIDKSEYFVTGYSLTDLYGNKNVYVFQNILINKGLPDSLFEYEPPSGVKIEKLS